MDKSQSMKAHAGGLSELNAGLGPWNGVNGKTKPAYGEHVIVATTDADDDLIAVTATYNGGVLYLATGGRKVKPALYWMRIPALHNAEIKGLAGSFASPA